MDYETNKETILIIDGYHLLHKGYYGSLKRKKVATNREGTKINAIYTFISKINQLIDYGIYRTIIVTFDVDKGCWRRGVYPDYKAKRKETPEDLKPQMQIVREFLTSANIPWYEKENYEGDDVMGTIARIGEKLGYNIHILSNDKDCYQLITKNTKVLSKGSRNEKTSYVDEDIVEIKMGCRASQVADMKSLMGDSSDNIKGVRYLHYQTAVNLLKKYENVEDILSHVDELPKNVQQRILDAKEQIILNKRITTIAKDLKLGRVNFNPLRVNWKGYIYFLKKNKMWVYLSYAENKQVLESKAREELKHQEPKPNKKVSTKKVNKQTPVQNKKANNSSSIPKSCNSIADKFILKKSNYFDSLAENKLLIK